MSTSAIRRPVPPAASESGKAWVSSRAVRAHSPTLARRRGLNTRMRAVSSVRLAFGRSRRHALIPASMRARHGHEAWVQRVRDVPCRLTTTPCPAGDLEQQLEQYRRELTGYCYRMLGSSFEAEDAVQETMLRAWRSIDRFEGRSALKSWLYRIATNVCMDMLNGRQRRARPMELTEVGTPESTLNTLPEVTWLEPIPDAHVLAGQQRRRSRRARAGPGDAAPGVRRGAAAPAGAPARGADPARGAALERRRDRRAARLERRVGQQRAAARAGDDRRHRADDRGRARSAGDGRRRAARPLRGRLRAVRHRLARRAAARGRDAVDAALRPLAARPRAHRGVASGLRPRLPRLAAHRDERQRPAGVRSVPPERARRQLRAVGAAGHRALKRADHGPQRVPRHGAPVPAVRAARRAPGRN